jgi:hypothetical protein
MDTPKSAKVRDRSEHVAETVRLIQRSTKALSDGVGAGFGPVSLSVKAKT